MAYLPVHEWRFEESSGNIAVDEYGGANGTYSWVNHVNGYVGIGAVQISGQAISFVSFPNSVALFGKADFTVAFWVSTSETLKLFDLLGNRSTDGHGSFLSIRMTGSHPSLRDGIVIAEIDQDASGAAYAGVQSTVSGLNDGHWHHVAVTRQGRNLSLYIDGQPAGGTTGAAIANISNSNPFKLGRSLVASGVQFTPNAMFDDVRIYDTALNAHEIASMNSWRLPIELRVVPTNFLLVDGDRGTLAAAHDSFLVIDAHGKVVVTTQDRSAAALFIFDESGLGYRLRANNNKWLVAVDGQLMATAASAADSTLFYCYLTHTGDVIWATGERQVWQLKEDLSIALVPPDRIELRNEFTLNLNPPSEEQLAQRHASVALDTLTPCEEAQAHLVWQLTGGLFLAVGLRSFITSGTIDTGYINRLVRGNPIALQALNKAIAEILRKPSEPVRGAVILLSSLWSTGLLRRILAYVLSTFAWAALFAIIAKILELVFAPEEEVIELFASFAVWNVQTAEAVNEVISACGREAPIAA